MSRPAAVQTHELARHFGPVRAVDGVSFRVEQGEIFGFLGPNGAGKTTTIHMLCTLLRPTSGTASVAGHDVQGEPDRVRASIGLVFQDPSLDEHLTAWENLWFHAVLYGVPAEEARRRMEEVLRIVDLWDRRGDRVEVFSGGMKRRLEIARGLVHRPRVLFLDEPTLGLDPQTRRHIWDYVLALRDRERLTIFMTTHYMDEAEHCDRIAIIDRGRIAAMDSPEGLKSMVGGDVVTVRTRDDEAALDLLSERFGLRAQRVRNGQGLEFEIEDGATFIPRLVQESPIPVEAISLRRPSLDDVFLKLTGRAIREAEADAEERARELMRRRRRLGMRR